MSHIYTAVEFFEKPLKVQHELIDFSKHSTLVTGSTYQNEPLHPIMTDIYVLSYVTECVRIYKCIYLCQYRNLITATF